MKNHRLTESVIGTAKVIVDILPKGKVIPGTVITPKTICIHNSGVVNAPPKNLHNYMKTCNKTGERIASWNFSVGYDEIYQAIPTNKKAWHSGTTRGNNESIGIEICMYNNAEKQKQAYLNAIELVKILMKYYGFDSSNVVRHYDYSKKNCPQFLIESKFGYSWKWFKEQVSGVVKEQVGFKQYLARCTTDNLNCRKGPGTTYDVERQINKGEVITIIDEKMNGSTKWLKAKSGYWVSAKYMEFIRYS